jgi:hypothetical protein
VKLARLLAALCLATPAFPAAAADFQGVLEMKGTQQVEKGRSIPASWTIYVSPAALRFEIAMDMEQARKEAPANQRGEMHSAFKMVTLTKLSEPHLAYLINDQSRSYSVLDSREYETQGGAQKKWTVRKLGGDRVAGYACEKFAATAEGEDTEIDGCVSGQFFGSDAWGAVMRRGTDRGDWVRALGSQGLKGLPIRLNIRRKGNPDAFTRYELVRAEKRSLPASTFDIPAGYRKADSPMEAMMSPEQQKAMRDAMEQMTPEQRKMVEEMMKKKATPKP